MIHYFFVEKT